MYLLFTAKKAGSYKVCLCFIMLSGIVCTVGYVCSFHGNQILVDFVTFLSMIINGSFIKMFYTAVGGVSKALVVPAENISG